MWQPTDMPRGLMAVVRYFDKHYWQMREALGYPMPYWVQRRWPLQFQDGGSNPYFCGMCEARKRHPAVVSTSKQRLAHNGAVSYKGATLKVWKEFTFEAAHSLPGDDDSPLNPNARLHGHSYKARVYLEGDPVNGMVVHMNDLVRAVDAVRFRLDHHNLNEVLIHARPTLETIAEFIAVSFHVGKVVRVDVWRPTCGDGAIWEAA